MANQAAYLELSDRRNIYGFKEQMGSKVDMPQAKIKGGLFTPGPRPEYFYFVVQHKFLFSLSTTGSAKCFTSLIPHSSAKSTLRVHARDAPSVTSQTVTVEPPKPSKSHKKKTSSNVILNTVSSVIKKSHKKKKTEVSLEEKLEDGK